MKQRLQFYLLILAFVLPLLFLAYLWFFPYAEKTAFIMNTPVRIKVEGQGAPHLANKALGELRRLDRLFNKFDPRSEIAHLNRASSEEPQEISADTAKVFTLAKKITKLSRGAFDITLGGKEEFKNQIDLGGIAKGYAAESARALLLKSGAKNGIIDMRSSIAVLGNREQRIGIRHPRVEGELLGTVTLQGGQSLSTSGDYERGQHIIDPRTGEPAELCQSVTVIGTNAAEVDALSTAIFVLGPTRGMRLANQLDVQALIVDKKGKVHDNFGFKLR
ncbi:FAD:protein FMN transferase [Candidatus Margulisiibacteriota bacterium]